VNTLVDGSPSLRRSYREGYSIAEAATVVGGINRLNLVAERSGTGGIAERCA
jgi:hypothetical protein